MPGKRKQLLMIPPTALQLSQRESLYFNSPRAPRSRQCSPVTFKCMDGWLRDSLDSSHPFLPPAAPVQPPCDRCGRRGAAACACGYYSSLDSGARWWSSSPPAAVRRALPSPVAFPVCCSWSSGPWALLGERQPLLSVRTELHSVGRFHSHCSM